MAKKKPIKIFMIHQFLLSELEAHLFHDNLVEGSRRSG